MSQKNCTRSFHEATKHESMKEENNKKHSPGVPHLTVSLARREASMMLHENASAWDIQHQGTWPDSIRTSIQSPQQE